MHADEASIGALMTSFLHAVSFKAGDQPRYGELPGLFSPHARLIRTSGPAPEISSIRTEAGWRISSMAWDDERDE